MTSSPPAPAQAVLLRAFLRPEWGLVLAIATVVVLTALLDDRHNYWYNPADSAVNILRQTSMLGIFALGAAIVIISGGIDLSSGSVIAFSGSMCAILLTLLAPEEMKESKNLSAGVISLAILGTLLKKGIRIREMLEQEYTSPFDLQKKELKELLITASPT